MKVLIYILISTVLSMGVGLKITFDNSLDYKNKVSNLEKKNKQLKTKNDTLNKKQKKFKDKMKDRRKAIISRNIKRAEKKLASAPTKMIPLIGIPVIIGMTASDVEAYCNDIEEFKKFENDIFDYTEESLIDENKKICGMTEEEIKKHINTQYDNVVAEVDTQSTNISNEVKKQIDEAIENINKYLQ